MILAEQKAENNNEQFTREKEIYDFSIKAVEIKLERKHHLEIKSLYILQATAVLITLFVGFQDTIGNISDSKLQANYIFFRNGFYLCILISLVALLLSLIDALTGQFKDFQHPRKLYFETDVDQTIKEYYVRQIEYLIISIDSIDTITSKKAKLFSIGVSFFVFAVFLLLIIGFIFV